MSASKAVLSGTKPSPIVVKRQKPAKRKVVHKTKTGRVVYNRRRHLFKISDILRIFRNIINDPENVPQNVPAKLTFFVSLVEALIAEYALSVGLAVPGAIIRFIADLLTYLAQGGSDLLRFIGEKLGLVQKQP